MKNDRTNNNHLSRRRFLQTAAGASAVLAFPAILKANPEAANERINLAGVGIGERGGQIINELMKTKMFNLVALCDTQLGAKHTQGLLKAYPDVPRFKDFRQMFDKMEKEIDAVSVGTPDHTHFPICMHAMALGKGVYVEKPLAHTFQQCHLLKQAEAKYKVACQMGNQGHSGGNYYQFRAMVKAGLLDDVNKVDAYMTKGRRWHKWNAGVPKSDLNWDQWFDGSDEKPEELDWDTWLGHVPFHNFRRDYIYGDWRCWFSFGMGALGDWGAHIIDTVHEFLELGMPESVDVEMVEGYNDHVFPMSSRINFKFPARGPKRPALDLVWSDGIGNMPELPEGFHNTKADGGDAPPSGGSGSDVKSLPPGKVIYRKDGVSFKGTSHASTLSVVKNDKAELAGEMPSYERNMPNHFKDFALGVKREKKCNSNFAVSAELSKVMCLGVIAQRLRKSIKFDSKKMQITNDNIANQLLVGPPPRKGWEQYYKL